MLHREDTENELSITEDGTPILTYCYGDPERPSYFHPIYAPNGQVVTEGADTRAQYPPGVCFALGTVNGEKLSQQPLTRERMPSTGETSEEFTITTTWRAQEPLLIETLTTQVHPRQTETQVLDIEISLHAPTTSLEFAGNTGVGYYAIEMEYRKAFDADGRIGESEVNGKTSAWGTFSGITTAEQNAVGVAIFPHQSNGETTFFAKDALFGFLFAQTAPFTVDAGETRTLKYRVLVYVGDLFTVDVWQYHQNYIG
jgi:hypothetical protein